MQAGMYGSALRWIAPTVLFVTKCSTRRRSEAASSQTGVSESGAESYRGAGVGRLAHHDANGGAEGRRSHPRCTTLAVQITAAVPG